MSFPSSENFEENLSDDLLSEGAESWKIKVSPGLLKNMDETPFKRKRVESECFNSLWLSQEKSNLKKDKLHSCILEDEEKDDPSSPWFSSLISSQTNSFSKRDSDNFKSTLKTDISNLLKEAIKGRIADSKKKERALKLAKESSFVSMKDVLSAPCFK